MGNVIAIIFGANGFDRSAQGLLGEGRRLADSRGSHLRAIIIGPVADDALSPVAQVSDEVLLADQSELENYQPETYLDALVSLCREGSADVILLGNDTYSQELAPRLAHRLGGSCVGDVVEISFSGERIKAARSVYGGKATAAIELKRSPAILWLRARAFSVAVGAGENPCQTQKVSLHLRADVSTKLVERKAESSGEVRLEDAQIIISGGRGLGGPEPFKELQLLADALGAQMAASRAACDAGWVPPSWQVGQTGKKVAPGLYIAIAISGASQHLAGISDAKVVAAINIDPDAPIFKRCRFGIVEDYARVVPLLRARLAALQK
jgi:electron transfer flavoprotein alpha subunit